MANLSQLTALVKPVILPGPIAPRAIPLHPAAAEERSIWQGRPDRGFGGKAYLGDTPNDHVAVYPHYDNTKTNPFAWEHRYEPAYRNQFLAMAELRHGEHYEGHGEQPPVSIYVADVSREEFKWASRWLSSMRFIGKKVMSGSIALPGNRMALVFSGWIQRGSLPACLAGADRHVGEVACDAALAATLAIHDRTKRIRLHDGRARPLSFSSDTSYGYNALPNENAIAEAAARAEIDLNVKLRVNTWTSQNDVVSISRFESCNADGTPTLPDLTLEVMRRVGLRVTLKGWLRLLARDDQDSPYAWWADPAKLPFGNRWDMEIAILHAKGYLEVDEKGRPVLEPILDRDAIDAFVEAMPRLNLQVGYPGDSSGEMMIIAEPSGAP